MAYPGTHCILELYDCPADRLNDHEGIIDALKAAISHAGATWLGEVSHQFTPHGVTALGLLSESHISIHTWPESGYAAVDVFTCGDVAMPEKACEFLIDAFGAEKHTLLKLARRPEPKPAEPISVEVLAEIG